MSIGMLSAVVLLTLGCWVFSLLRDPALVGIRAFSLCVLAMGLWIFSVLQAILDGFDRARRMLEAAPIEIVPPAPEPAYVRNMLQVDQAKWVMENVLNPSDLRVLAFGLLDGRPFSEREWRGQIKEFRRVQDEFERRGLVRMVGKKRLLNSRGRRAMLAVAYHRAPLPRPSVG